MEIERAITLWVGLVEEKEGQIEYEVEHYKTRDIGIWIACNVQRAADVHHQAIFYSSHRM